MSAGTDRQGGSAQRSRETASWVLFLFCAVFFVVSAPGPADVPGLIGALLFLLACAVFLLPYLARTFAVAGPKNTRPS